MTTLRTLRQSAKPEPTTTMLLEPDAYAPDYARRPSEDIAIGIKLLSESDMQAARKSAVEYTADLYPTAASPLAQLETFNDALVCGIVARCATDPNDARTPFFPGDEEEVREALTSDGCAAIYDAYECARDERSPLAPEASDDEIAELPVAWARCLGMVQPARQRHLRRLAGVVLKALLDAEGADANDTGDE